MSTQTGFPTDTARPTPLGPPRHPGFGSVLRSEWTKIRSVRSTLWTLAVTALITIGIGVIASAVVSGHWNQMNPADQESFVSTDFTLGGINLGQLAIAVLGVMVVTGEYATGMIRTSLAAVPHRARLLAAKALVLAAVAFIVGEIVSFISFFGGEALLTNTGKQNSLSDPGVLRTVIGGGLYLTVLGLFALGLGAILRHTAAGITAVLGILLVLPVIVRLILSGVSWRHDVVKYLPNEAGVRVWALTSDPQSLSAWSGFAVFCAYAAVALAAGFWVLLRRDA